MYNTGIIKYVYGCVNVSNVCVFLKLLAKINQLQVLYLQNVQLNS